MEICIENVDLPLRARYRIRVETSNETYNITWPSTVEAPSSCLVKGGQKAKISFHSFDDQVLGRDTISIKETASSQQRNIVGFLKGFGQDDMVLGNYTYSIVKPQIQTSHIQEEVDTGIPDASVAKETKPKQHSSLYINSSIIEAASRQALLLTLLKVDASQAQCHIIVTPSWQAKSELIDLSSDQACLLSLDQAFQPSQALLNVVIQQPDLSASMSIEIALAQLDPSRHIVQASKDGNVVCAVAWLIEAEGVALSRLSPPPSPLSDLTLISMDGASSSAEAKHSVADLTAGKPILLDPHYAVFGPSSGSWYLNYSTSLAPKALQLQVYATDVVALEPKVDLDKPCEASNGQFRVAVHPCSLAELEQAASQASSTELVAETQSHPIDSDVVSTTDPSAASLQADAHQEELQKLTKLIQNKGKDVVGLRERHAELLAQNRTLQRRLMEDTAVNEVHLSVQDITSMPREELASSYVQLSNEFNAVHASKLELQESLQYLQNDLIELNTLKRTILKLEHTHAQACTEAQLYQTRLERVGKYKDVFKTQLKVIEAIEQAIVQESADILDPSTMLSGSRYQRLQAKLLMLEERRKYQRKQQAKVKGVRKHDQASEEHISKLKLSLQEQRNRVEMLRARLHAEHKASGKVVSKHDVAALEERRTGLEQEIERLKVEHQAAIANLNVKLAGFKA